MSRKPAVRLCRGADCQKKTKAQARLLDVLVGRVRVVPVKCQKICEGPVVGLEIDGEVEWFESLRGKEARAALVGFLEGSGVAPALKKRRVKKRSGRIR